MIDGTKDTTKVAVVYQDDAEEIEEPEVNKEVEVGDDKYCFIFLVDRSYSMGGKMEITREALKLFV